MEQLIKVNFDTQMVSARDLHEALEKSNSFKDFFINVSTLRTHMNNDNLRVLRKVVWSFAERYGTEAIIYLVDSIDCEAALPMNNLEPKKITEEVMRKEIVANFNILFPKLKYLGKEVTIGEIGRADILAEDIGSSRKVIFELKTGHKNPTQQLLAYGSHYNNPLLVGITQEPLSKNKKHPKILYLIMDDLKEILEENKKNTIK